MKIAVYGKKFGAEAKIYIERLYEQLLAYNIELLMFRDLHTFLRENCGRKFSFGSFATHQELLEFHPDFVITIGGDGTILDATTLVRDSGIPIVGVNTGRLGFLSNVAKEDIQQALDALVAGRYEIDKRRLLSLQCPELEMESNLNFALNEISVSRKDTTSMVHIKVWVDGEFLNNYWADGLILATPTGSTGYSMSCNGPIIMPGSGCLVVTPIAPHNLTARPLIIPDSSKIRLEVNSREEQNLVSLDSRIYNIGNGLQLDVEMANFHIQLVEVAGQSFFQTLQNKLMWGLDRRNYSA